MEKVIITNAYCDRDYMNVYISRTYRAGKWICELEINDDWGINT